MAVTDMKRLLLVADRASREQLLLTLQRLGCVELSDFTTEEAAQAEQGHAQQELAKAEQDLQRLRSAITRLGRFSGEKTSMFSAKPAASLEQLMPGEEERALCEGALQKLEQLERQGGELRGRRMRIDTQAGQLQPWSRLDIPLTDIRDSRFSRQFLGTLPKAALEPLQAELAGRECLIEVLDQQRDLAHIWALAHASCAVELSRKLKDLGFTSQQLGSFEGTVAQELDALQEERGQLQQEEQDLQAGLQALAVELPRLRVYHDALQGRRDRLKAGDRLLHTRETILLRGWMPAPLEASFRELMARDYPQAQLSLSDPEPGDEPPVLLRNNRFATPFEGVVEGFSLPAYGSLDPTAALAPFFACFFGMMVSDAGYGLMMMLLVPLLMHLTKPSKAGRKLFLMIAIGGVFTLFWGFIYNTWFGFAPMQKPIMDPINQPLNVMMLCVAVGAVHLLVGLGLGAVQHIRRGKYIDVVYDQLSWLLLLAGIGLMVVPGLAAVGQWMALAGVLIILVFAGREKTRNPLKRLISGLGALYGISSWLSDLLSYLRLFGMGLATGVIGMVFNILIGMVFQAGPVGWVLGAVLFVGCHLFNAGINILGAYVHSSRLQYIEFFSKFYEDGGLSFKPLAHSPRYVRISDA